MGFSKVMKRRVTIAMALIHRPRILLLDEPTSGMDVQSVLLIRQMMRQLHDAGTTIFLTTHNIEEANQSCQHVAIIHRGKIAAIDSPERLKQAFQSVQAVEVGGALIPHLVEWTQARHLTLTLVNTLGPSLEDVFVKITGLEIATGEPEENEQGRRGKGMGRGR